ncbi:MAG: MFS transporter [Candidatus Asgardarchaeia archaeon]
MRDDDSRKSTLDKNSVKKLYAFSLFNGLSTGISNSLVNLYAVDVGFGYAEMGVLRGVGNIMPTLFQPIFGIIGDKTNKRKYLVFLGYFFGSMAIPILIYVRDPLAMILVYGIQTFLTSIAIPNISAIISHVIPEVLRGTLIGKINAVSNVANLISTVLSGIVMTLIFFDKLEGYYPMFFFSAITGIVSSFIILTLEDPIVDNSNLSLDVKLFGKMFKDQYFGRFLIVSAFFSLSMSLAWPYFSIILLRFVKASKLEVSISNVLTVVTQIILQPYFGKLSDKVGRKSLIMTGRLILPLIPVIYALSPNIIPIYFASVLVGVSMAMVVPSLNAYIFDISHPTERGTYTAFYNLLTGIMLFFGSLFGGLFGDFLSEYLGMKYAVITVMLLSGALRLLGSSFYLTVKEPKKYDFTLKEEVLKELKMFVENIRSGLKG